MSSSQNSASSATYINGNTTLLAKRRVYDIGGRLRYASDSELENGITTRRVFPNEPAGIDLLDDAGPWTLIANGPIAKDAPVFRAAQGKVSATGTSQIGRAGSTVGADGEEVQIVVVASGGGGVAADPSWVEYRGNWASTGAIPAVDTQGASYYVPAPATPQTHNFGDGPVIINGPGHIRSDGTRWHWQPAGAGGVTGPTFSVVPTLAAITTNLTDVSIGHERKVTASTATYRLESGDGSNASHWVLSDREVEATEAQAAAVMSSGNVANIPEGFRVVRYEATPSTSWKYTTADGWQQDDASGGGGGSTTEVDTLATVTGRGTTTATDIEITNSATGVIYRAPDGSRWRQTVDNAGQTVRTRL